MVKYLYYYFFLINIIGIISFALDKHFAIKGMRRISEKQLHTLEFLGGIIGMLPMMYIIRHKNRKFQYYIYSYLIALLWCAGVFVWYNGGAQALLDYLKSSF